VKRIAVLVFLVAALAASSAFAQAPRWEYAFLTVMGDQMAFEYQSLKLSSQELGMQDFVEGLVYGFLEPAWGSPAGVLRRGGEGKMLVLTLLGYMGFQIASTVQFDSYRVHFLMRPVR
jgi:hypothetical protein